MKRLTVSQNAVFNTLGTVVFCFCQWIISSLLVVHLSSKEDAVSNAGILQLAISITNIFFSISTYNIRTYQISDTENKYSYGDYIGTRFVTAVIALVLCVAYVLLCGYSYKSTLCIIFYMIFKLNETFSDVLHGIDQKNYRMDYVGISLAIRGCLMAVVFATMLILTNDMLISIASMAVITLAVVILYDINVTRQFGSVKPNFNRKKITNLLTTCFPTVVALVSFTATASVPRQALEKALGEEALGFYGTIATPLMVVQVMATSIFNPMLTELAIDYNIGKKHEFVKRILKNVGFLVAITGFVFSCVVFAGKFAVGIVFGKEFVAYTYLMYGIIACTALYVLSWLCTNVLVIMRKLNECMAASLVSLAVSVLLSNSFIKMFEMNGASYVVIIAYIIHILICIAIIAKTLKER